MRLPRLYPNTPEGREKEYRVVVRWARRLLPIDRNKVTFVCFQGRSYGDNPRCISERLHELRPETDIVWAFRADMPAEQRAEVPDYVRRIPMGTRKTWVEMATARVWVDNFTKLNVLRGFRKDRQFYVQTWHGDRAIKKICFDAFPGDYRLEQDASLVLTGSDFGQRMFRTAFHYSGEYLNMGAPRNDILVRNDPAEAAAVRKKLGVPEGVKLLLYAPTYREHDEIVPKRAQMDLGRVLNLLERGGEKWLCLYRAHYQSKGIDLEAVQGRLVDMTTYANMSELLLVSDMLLTDYSSSAMDFCLLDRPAFMYMADWEEYLASRPCYYDPHDTPLMIAHNQEELEKLILETDAEKARENCRAIREWYGMNETGQATDAVCRYIIDKLEPPKRSR